MRDNPTDRLSSVFTLTPDERRKIKALSVADLLDAANRIGQSQQELGRLMKEMIEEDTPWP